MGRFSISDQFKLAKDYYRQAKLRLKTSKRALEEEAFAYSIRQSQEAIELALKGALRLVGLDFPKWHDVGPILEKEKEKFPKEFQEIIPTLVSVSEQVANLREEAMYGNEEKKKGPSALFKESDSKSILVKANLCMDAVKDLFLKFKKSKNNTEK